MVGDKEIENTRQHDGHPQPYNRPVFSDNETLLAPIKGSSIAWSKGIRNWPGKEVSQGKFVVEMAVLFPDWRVNPAPEPHEGMDAARKRVHTILETETEQVLLSQLLHPKKTVFS